MSIRIFDTTLRDGEQSPGVSLNPEEKVVIAKALSRLRVDIIEAGFPIASLGDREAVSRIAGEVEGPVICALARTREQDIRAAGESLQGAARRRIHVFSSTSPVHLKYVMKKSEAEVLRDSVEAVKLALTFTPDVEFSCQDATRSDPVFLAEIVAAVTAAGATTINLPDTVGYTTPEEFRRLIGGMRQRFPDPRVAFSVHCHNDLGLAVANSLAAVEAGATQVECAVNGIGERAGNASLEEVVMALITRKDHFGQEVGVVTEHIHRTSLLVSSLTGMAIAPNKAVVGPNAFAHESGIHQDGVLQEPSTYEIMRPETVGAATSRLVLGKHSGRHAFRERLTELGYQLTDEDLARAFRRFKELADRKKSLTDQDLEALLEEAGEPEDLLALEAFQVVSGNRTVPTATVTLREGETIRNEAAVGDGPVEASFAAIARLSGIEAELTEYSLRAVTGGPDALGEVILRLRRGEKFYTGRGVSTDVIEASVRAYMSAVNKILGAERQERGGV